jgi:hypothetical protein
MILANGDLYLAAISTKPDVRVLSVTGLNLTWMPVVIQCSGRSQTGLEVWWSQGEPSGPGNVTVDLSGTPSNAVIAVSRYSGVAGDNPIGNFVSGNTNGPDGACTGGADGSVYSFDLTTTEKGAVIYSTAAIRNRSHIPGATYTELYEISQGAGGNMVGLAAQDRTVDLVSTVAVDGSFSKKVDWTVIGLVIRPGGS